MVGVITVIGREIDKPTPINEMQFRRPNIIRILASSWRCPNTHTRVLPDSRDVARAPNENLPFIPRFGIIVVPAVENHPRVGRMRWQDRVNKITFVAR